MHDAAPTRPATTDALRPLAAASRRSLASEPVTWKKPVMPASIAAAHPAVAASICERSPEPPRMTFEKSASGAPQTTTISGGTAISITRLSGRRT